MNIPLMPGPPSACQPFLNVIRGKLEQGLSAQRIFQDLRCEHGFTGSYYGVRRFVAKLQAKTPLPVRRIETAAGEVAQEWYRHEEVSPRKTDEILDMSLLVRPTHQTEMVCKTGSGSSAAEIRE